MYGLFKESVTVFNCIEIIKDGKSFSISCATEGFMLPPRVFNICFYIKEKLTPKQIVGVAIGTAALILFNIKL